MELQELCSYLPSALGALLLRAAKGITVSEVRLRLGKYASLSVYREGKMENISLPYTLTEEEIRQVLSAVCGDSVYTHEESIKQGYIKMAGGCRLGVVGAAITEKGHITRLLSVEGLVFRLHRRQAGAAEALLSAFRLQGEGRESILVYGPPGCGKTTVLREFAREISRGKEAKRAVLLDGRGEFGDFEAECLLDVLSGYPSGEGIEIAVRTLSPEVLILDEIGKEEALSLAYAVGCGVPIVASAHGSSQKELLQRKGVSGLLREGAFSYLYRVESKTVERVAAQCNGMA